jgi:hypothetical protein
LKWVLNLTWNLVFFYSNICPSWIGPIFHMLFVQWMVTYYKESFIQNCNMKIICEVHTHSTLLYNLKLNSIKCCILS